ncbi:MAG TPA: mechanosensitive ion channel family protein [Candidatus Solibacter sp.]|nr:mechanosensitive ion channel family protein [Candidatus Solibacter sp.]
MKTRQKIAAILLIVLLAGAAYGLYRTAQPFAAFRSRKMPPGWVRPEALVDQTPLTTAQNLAQLSNSSGEQRFAEEALRLADHEVDLAFAAALRDASENPPPLSAEAKKIQARLTRAQNALDADTEQVSKFTAAEAKASGSRKEKLDDDLNLVKAQLDLDQDNVEDAKEDLMRAGGDPRAVIQQMVQEHEAATHNAATTVAAATAPAQGRALIVLYRQWSELHQKEAQLEAAEKAAESAAATITAKHNALEAQLDATSAGRADALQASASVQPTAPEKQAATASLTVTVPDYANLSADDASALLDKTKRRASARKALGELDKRIDDERQLAETYDNWLVLDGAKERSAIHKALISLTVILGILLVALFFDDWFEKLLGKTALDRRQIETLRTVTRVTLQVLAVVLILLVIFGLPSQLGTFLGLAGAGLTVALKDFIVGFIGWLVLMGKNGIRLGDWVEINGVTGEVVELGMFHTVLLETGNWTDSGHPTGRRVTFTNSFAIEGHYFNFSTSGQWLWDELQLVLPLGKDPYPIVDAFHKKVLEATAESSKQAEKEWQSVARSKDSARTLTAAPAINVKPVVGGVEIAVRYITRANDRYQLRAKLNQAAVDLLGQDNPAKPTPSVA